MNPAPLPPLHGCWRFAARFTCRSKSFNVSIRIGRKPARIFSPIRATPPPARSNSWIPGKWPKRRLLFLAHGRGQIEPDAFLSQSAFLEAIRGRGIPTNPLTRLCRSIEEVWQTIEDFDKKRADLAYGVDGVVVKVDRVDQQEQLGYTSKSPRCVHGLQVRRRAGAHGSA